MRILLLIRYCFKPLKYYSAVKCKGLMPHNHALQRIFLHRNLL